MDLRAELQRRLGDGLTLERELPGGGMARVFVARDERLGRSVVVKTLREDVAATVSAERFHREIRLAASLQQANIVPVHTAGDAGGIPYYTMPYVDGEDLRARLAAGHLPVRTTVNILRDVARALAYAHDRGVIHRDIKPENILLSGDTAVVTDFGIAKAIEAAHAPDAPTTLTALGTLIGTPFYMSPEQATGDAVDHRADIYAFGVMAYEMLAGERPFTGSSVRAVLGAHLGAPPPPLAGRRAGLPARLVALVMRCLEKAPDRRPQRAGDLISALDAALTNDAGAPDATAAIAVLPFANLSPDPADEFFADGLTDEIITDLAGIRSLRVIARSAMMRYKGLTRQPSEIADELHVRYVLDGSVRRAGHTLRLTARLLDVHSDATIWADKINGVVDDIFDMQERVSRTIVDALALRLSPREAARLSERPINDLAAYQAYLKARLAIWTFDSDQLASALRLIKAAAIRIGENPRLIAAEALAHLGFIETGRDDAAPHLAAVAACVERLTAIDPTGFGTHAVTGMLAWRRGHIREAIAALGRALEIEPNNSDVAVYLVYAYLLAGQDATARELADRYTVIDPLTPLFQVMPGFCEVMAGRADAGVPYYRRYAESEPNNPIAAYFYLVTLAETDDRAATTAAAVDVARRFPETVFGAIARIYADVTSGRTAAHDVALTQEMRAHSARSDAFARPLAALLSRMGATELALDALEDSIRLGLAHYPYLARHSRAFAPVRHHPRFRRLLECVRERWERGGTAAEDLARPAPAVTPAGAPRPSVAVLPFANLSADPDNDYVASGITDDLIAELARIGALRVIARTSVLRYGGTRHSPSEIGAALGVTAIVEGTVRRAGRRARIVVQLVDATTDTPVWSETYDRDLEDVFGVQAEVAERVATALEATLTGTERRRLAARPAIAASAYETYLLGRHHWNRRTDDSLRRAIRCFEQCLAEAPGFAPAHGGLADAYIFAALGYASLDISAAFAQARAAAEAALAIDPESPEGLCALANCAMHGDWQPERARDLLERAIALNPNHVPAYQWLAWIHFSRGDYVGAVQVQKRALERDPLSVTLLTECSWPFLYARLYGHARSRLVRALEVDPAFPLARYNLAFIHQANREYPAAIREYEAALAGLGRVGFVLATLASAYVETGRRADAEAILRELYEQSRTDARAWLSIALVADDLGDVDGALEALERASQLHAPFINGLALEGWLPLRRSRQTPRFRILLDRLGLRPHDVAGQRALLEAAEPESADRRSSASG
jgi:serine/threonine-protein kinase